VLKLHKDNGLTRMQLSKKAKKKIPLYEARNSNTVKVPFLDVRMDKMRYIEFYKIDGEWAFVGIAD
jgi:hypothetical protein